MHIHASYLHTNTYIRAHTQNTHTRTHTHTHTHTQKHAPKHPHPHKYIAPARTHVNSARAEKPLSTELRRHGLSPRVLPDSPPPHQQATCICCKVRLRGQRVRAFVRACWTWVARGGTMAFSGAAVPRRMSARSCRLGRKTSAPQSQDY